MANSFIESLSYREGMGFAERLFRTSFFCIAIGIDFDLHLYSVVGLIFVPFLMRCKL